MTDDKVKPLRRAEPLPVSDFWFAQIDLRLSRLEAPSNRIERGLSMLIYGGFTLLVIEGRRLLVSVGPGGTGQ